MPARARPAGLGVEPVLLSRERIYKVPPGPTFHKIVGDSYLHMADELGEEVTDSAFAALFSRRGQPAHAPWRLALAPILQFAEGLSDR